MAAAANGDPPATISYQVADLKWEIPHVKFICWILTGDRDFVLVSSLYGEERHKTKWPDNQERPREVKWGQERPTEAITRPDNQERPSQEAHKAERSTRGEKFQTGRVALVQRGFILDECQGRVGGLWQRRWSHLGCWEESSEKGEDEEETWDQHWNHTAPSSNS